MCTATMEYQYICNPTTSNGDSTTSNMHVASISYAEFRASETFHFWPIERHVSTFASRAHPRWRQYSSWVVSRIEETEQSFSGTQSIAPLHHPLLRHHPQHPYVILHQLSNQRCLPSYPREQTSSAGDSRHTAWGEQCRKTREL